jgi:hypothetical protein
MEHANTPPLIAIIGTLIAIIGTLIAIIGTLIAIIGTLIAIIGLHGAREHAARHARKQRKMRATGRAATYLVDVVLAVHGVEHPEPEHVGVHAGRGAVNVGLCDRAGLQRAARGQRNSMQRTPCSA